MAEAPGQGQPGGTAHREAVGAEDHPAQMVGVQDLHPGGNQAQDYWPLPGRVLYHLQAYEAQSHPLLLLHPP